PVARATEPPRPPHRRRLQVRLGRAVCRRHRPARPLSDLPAPGPPRAGDAHRRAAAVVARPLRPPAPREPPDMTDEERLIALRDLIQQDVGRRGLRAVPGDNLITACEGDFAAACRGLASAEAPRVAVVTGFTIAGSRPPCAETDGPLGALFLARAPVPLGIPVAIATDGTALPALRAGLAACGLTDRVQVFELPDVEGAYTGSIDDNYKRLSH